MSSRLFFYDPSQENGFLANFSEDPIEISGKRYKTVEHYYQSQKFANTDIQLLIMEAKTPWLAKQIAKDNNNQRRSDWGTVKEDIMFEGIYAKFTQHNGSKKLLKATGDCLIVELTCDDLYWGLNSKEEGKNRMGYLLMKLRDIL